MTEVTLLERLLWAVQSVFSGGEASRLGVIVLIVFAVAVVSVFALFSKSGDKD